MIQSGVGRLPVSPGEGKTQELSVPGQEWHKSAETGREPSGGATSQQRKGLVFPPQAPVDTAEHVPVGSPPQILERRRTPKVAMCPNPADGRLAPDKSEFLTMLFSRFSPSFSFTGSISQDLWLWHI